MAWYIEAPIGIILWLLAFEMFARVYVKLKHGLKKAK